MKTAFYDFAVSPYSYDYTSFLHCALAHGCERVVLVKGKRSWSKLTEQQEQERLQNIILPLYPAIYCEREEARQYWTPDCYPVGYTIDKPLPGFALHKSMRVLKSTNLPVSEKEWIANYLGAVRPIVLTLRQSNIQPERNSDVKEWLRFAEWLESKGYFVVIVPDTDALDEDYRPFRVFREAMDVRKRLALYDAAYLNISVNNGPMGLYLYSNRPCLIFKMICESYHSTSKGYFQSAGLPPGAQPIWFNQSQRIIWTEDSFEELKDGFQQWERVREGGEWPERVIGAFPVRGAETPEARFANMAHAITLGLPMLTEGTARGEASICGFGPSLLYTFQEIKGDVFSTSGAHDFLISKGIVPKYHVEVDPRAHKSVAIKPHRDVTYLIASCCHPSLFEKLQGFNVVLWHADGGEDYVDWVAKNHPGNILIGGGSNSGLRACEIAGTMGYRPLNCFGMDASFMWGQRHAGAHTGKSQKPMLIRCGTRQFLSTPAMIEGAREFLQRASQGMEATLYGDGLLQEMARQTKVASHAD